MMLGVNFLKPENIKRVMKRSVINMASFILKILISIYCLFVFNDTLLK